MNEESKLDAQIEWFHAFAAQSHGELVDQATEMNRTAFLHFVKACLPDHAPSQDQSPEEFATAVRELRDNERQWNQALMSALIQADDLHKSQGWQAAVFKLRAFAGSCPWKGFQEVAQVQAANYRPRPQQ